jgi:hypothetical protein
MKKTLSFALFCFLSSMGATSPARADDACAADRERLCASAQGPFQKNACMQANEAGLSPACQAQRAQVKEAVREVHQDCRPDAVRLCQGTVPGGGRIKQCLRAHEAELSPVCQQAVAKVQQLKQSIHPGCRADVGRLCQGVAPGGGRIIACLQSHPAELSPSCKTQLDQRAARRAAAGQLAR